MSGRNPLADMSGFVAPCLTSKAVRPPSGPLWIYEIKHDGYRLMVRRAGTGVRCFTRNGHDRTSRFPAIVAAALRIKAASDDPALTGCGPPWNPAF